MAENQASVKRIVRASHDTENPYFMMLRATAQNKALSYEARGLIAYLLSKPDDWEVMIEDLCQECGRGRVYRIIKDLLDAKYLERIYHRDDKGKIVYVEYVVHEQPFIENPKVDKPKVGKQKKGNPKVGNRTRHKRDSTHKKEKEQKTDTTLDFVLSSEAKAIVNAFYQAQTGYTADREEHFVDDAEWLAEHSHPQDVIEYVAQLRKLDFWAMKVISLSYIRQHITTEYRPQNGNGNGKPRISANQQVLIQQRADELGVPYEVLEADYLAEWNK